MAEGPSQSAAGAFLSAARAAGVELWTEGSRLRFRAPPNSLAPSLREDLANNREEIVAILQAEAEDHIAMDDLAANQLGLWFLQKLLPENSAYNVQFSFKIWGDLDSVALNEALQVVTDRHESVRTSYPVVNNKPQRRIVGRLPVNLVVTDVRDKSEVEIHKHITRDCHRAFDMDRGPLFRVHLYRDSDESQIFLLVAHHLVVDGTALFVLVQELFSIYEALVNKQKPPNRGKSATFSDFVEWQKNSIKMADDVRLYWNDVLTPSPEPLNVPVDNPRPAIRAMRGSSYWHQIDTNTTGGLKNLAKQCSATNFVVYMSLWFTFLYRISGTSDIIVGTPVLGRPASRFAGTVGDLVNMLPIRARDLREITFIELVALLRTTILDAMERQDFPLPLMAEQKNSDEYRGQPPFQTAFALQEIARSTPLQQILLAPATQRTPYIGLEVSSYRLDQQEGQFELSLDIWPNSDGLLCCWRFDSDLLHSTTIESWSQCLQTLAESVNADPDRPLLDLPILSDDVRKTIEVDFNATTATLDGDDTFLRAFHKRVGTSPQSAAIRSGDEALSYRDLDERSNQLAAYLLEKGLQPGELVGICLDRTVDMVTGTIAIFKAGCAYLPLDPSFPKARIRYMLEDSQAKWVLTHTTFLDLLSTSNVATLCVDRERGSIASSEMQPLPVVSGGDTAYVIYTSGSTGNPKGVRVHHRALINFLRSMENEPGINSDDTLLAVTTLSFDIAGLELFLPLIAGASVVIAGNAVTANGQELAKLIESSDATVMQATPATWRLLFASGWRGSEKLTVLCGGEALPRDLAAELVSKTGAAWNMYGPTETTIWSSCYRLSENGVLLIGKPINNTQMYVLDQNRRSVPLGVAGELYIGGEGVTLGYLNRSQQTADRFVANPFSANGDSRLYRTGDSVRYRTDGNLEYLHRLDDQVKVRGYRIELGEIEVHLASHPGIEQAVVAVQDLREGDQRLAAFFRGKKNLASAELRETLRQHLPNYMIPHEFVRVEEIPLTPNGKVDRRVLLTYLGSQVESDVLDEYAAPRSATESKLANLWKEILKVDSVGADDNFFEKGGHSLLAAKLNAMVNKAFEVDLPLQDIFEAPTLAELAGRIESKQHVDSALVKLPLLPQVSGQPVRASYAQQRLWYLYKLEGASAVYNLPFHLKLTGELDSAALAQSMNDIMSRHDILRTYFEEVDSIPIQQLHDFEMDIPITQISDGTDVKDYLTELSEIKFDLAKGPLARVQITQVDNDNHILTIVLHHTIADGLSVNILLSELIANYSCRVDGRAIDIERLPVQYADYSIWQRQWLEGGELDRQLDYWREKLAGELPVLEMPTDRTRGVQSYKGAMVYASVDGDFRATLEEFCHANDCTMFMVLLAAYNGVLRRYTGQSDLIVGTPVANRGLEHLDKMIGMFANTVVLRTDCSNSPTFTELIRRVRSTCIEAFGHQDMPFERLIQELNPARDPTRTPVFQTLFTFQTSEGLEKDFADDISMEPVRIDSTVAHTDLSVWVWDTGDSIELALEYSTDLFDEASVQQFLGHFSSLMKAAVDSPGIGIDELDFQSEAQREQQLVEWNATVSAFPQSNNFIALFDRQVRRAPDSVAVEYGGQSISYRELDEHSNRLTHYLVKQGVDKGTLVGVCLERSEQMLIAVIAIMKAGAAYLPLDPEYPQERLKFIVEDAKMPVLVTSTEHLAVFDSELMVSVCIDRDAESIEQEGSESMPISIDPDDIAYVIYTSGSTGKPKGVQVPHLALANFLQAMASEPGLQQTDTLLAVTTLSFDISGLELFLPLIVGARLAIAADAVVIDGSALAELIDSSGATVMQATPATWRLLFANGWQGSTSLRVFCGGEALPRELAEELVGKVSEAWNMYGPTETTIWSSVYRLEADGPVLIGKPIDNTQMYVLDRNRRPVPLGVAGELYIGGDGVTAGYLNRPELTAERFVADSFSDDAGARLYRTGDAVRYRADGNLEYLHRLDDQVKVRGYRIELGEIESQLIAQSDISQAVVTVREMAGGDHRLVAFYVLAEGENTTVTVLRSHLKLTLPGYMIPQHFVEIDAIPLTPNGKVDRKSLPGLSGATENAQHYVAPRSKAEKQLASIWAETLGVNRVGLHDNFFDIGGHSLLAVKVIAAMEAKFPKQVSLQSLTSDTLAQIAVVYNDKSEDISGGALTEKRADNESSIMAGFVKIIRSIGK